MVRVSFYNICLSKINYSHPNSFANKSPSFVRLLFFAGHHINTGPIYIKFTELHPNSRYRIIFTGIESDASMTRIASFKTLSKKNTGHIVPTKWYDIVNDCSINGSKHVHPGLTIGIISNTNLNKGKKHFIDAPIFANNPEITTSQYKGYYYVPL